jgi:hypothetical protein
MKKFLGTAKVRDFDLTWNNAIAICGASQRLNDGMGDM